MHRTFSGGFQFLYLREETESLNVGSRGCCKKSPSLKPQKCVPSQCWKPEVRNQGAEPLLRDSPGRGSVLAPSSIWRLPGCVVCGRTPSVPPQSSHCLFSVYQTPALLF